MLGNGTDEHQKAFMPHRRGSHPHQFDMEIAPDCMWAGALFQWKLDTTDNLCYSLKADDYSKLLLFDRTGKKRSMVEHGSAQPAVLAGV